MNIKKFSLKPLSLRARFLLATAAVILSLTLSYGVVAILGYLVSFDKTNYTLLRSQSNLFYSLAQWSNNRLDIRVPPNFILNAPSLVIIYDDHDQIIWRQRQLPVVEKMISKKWLATEGLHELETDLSTTRELLKDSPNYHQQLDELDEDDEPLIHSLSVNQYAKTDHLPALKIVVIDPLPQDLQKTDLVWEWFGYVLLANLILVIPLLWLAAYWSLRPIKLLITQISGLEKGERETLDENPPAELRGLVRNLNALLSNERKRNSKYRTTLSDLTHSLKTPLAVLQSTLRSLRSGKQMTIEQAEPIMIEQIGRISQQIGYYLHRATMRSSDNNMMLRELTSVSVLLDSLISALHKVYQRKDVVITLDISPEITWLGQPNDFMEVMGNILENACKYCLEFVEVTARVNNDSLAIIVDDDGPGVPESKRDVIFMRGQRVDTMRPGQGLGLSIASEIIDQYDGEIQINDSPLGGAQLVVIFRQQSVIDDN
ncbi:two-component system sensor histidine kinase PhoQ [Moellerella wisconsensis]|uniref:histidine kinase n=1 Tax=Moellerella wisconsensis ATCC 35017 TaxID=1354267 RepID=A0A0N0IAC1_9GAMM|nr:two-component system sensor histidine kinase PhoQ [Moellerella wisconsensis]KPD02591.1 PhoQ family sensor protein [Moellerella wisconsensis ATCC 35017]